MPDNFWRLLQTTWDVKQSPSAMGEHSFKYYIVKELVAPQLPACGRGRKTTGSVSIDGPYLTKALALLHKTTIRLLQHCSLDLQTHDVIQRGIVQANALTRMLCHVEWIKRKIPNIWYQKCCIQYPILIRVERRKPLRVNMDRQKMSRESSKRKRVLYIQCSDSKNKKDIRR